jgi:vacuolar-type H+-ATPase subunit I/STV1
MPNIQLSREGRLILAAGAILLAAALVYRFYPALSEAFSVSDEVAVKIRQIRKYQEVIAKQDALRKEKKTLQKRLKSLESSLLAGSTESLAAVNLQDFIKKITSAGNMEIDAIRVLTPESGEGADYTLIPVRFTTISGIRQLKDLLFQIESARQLLIVQELSVDSLEPRRPGEIRATITVAGVMPKSGRQG